MVLLLVTLLLILSSCGPVQLVVPEAQDTYIETSMGTPIPLSFAQEVCSEQDASSGEGSVSSVITFNLMSLFSSETNLIIKDIVEIKPDIFSLKAGGDFESYFNYNSETKNLRREKLEIEPAKQINLCPSQNYGNQKTFESAGAHVYSSIARAKAFLTDLDVELPELKYIIAPSVKRIVINKTGRATHTEKTHLINNAYFDYKYQEIVFLPQGYSDSGKIPFNGIPLWTVPFVPVHEVGHHVFSQLMPSFFKKRSSLNKVCFDNRGADKIHYAQQNEGQKRIVNGQLVLTAINEGFSDLFAFYTLGKDINLNGLSCLSVSRDVSSNKFMSGDPKNLTSKNIDKFLLSTYLPQTNCLEETNYQDVHMIGAIIASALDSTLNIMDFDKKAKMRFTMKWIQKLNIQLTAKQLNKTPKKILKNSFNLLLRLLKSNEKFNKEAQGEFVKRFPFLV